MDRCALEFTASRLWRRADAWIIAVLLVTGGAVLGSQSGFWSLASNQANQEAEIRAAYVTSMAELDRRLDELSDKAESAATKASKAATTSTEAADKADEPINRIIP